MSFFKCLRWCVFGSLAAVGLNCATAQTFDPRHPPVKDVPDILVPALQVEEKASIWAASLVTVHGKEGAVKRLASFAAAKPLRFGELYAIRRVGQELQPEFGKSVIDELRTNNDPFAKGRLLMLLREATADDVPAVARWLADRRTAEELDRHARGEGAIPFRFCDIAYNVLLEILAEDKEAPLYLIHSMTFEDRDKFISRTRGDAVEAKAPQKSSGRRD